MESSLGRYRGLVSRSDLLEFFRARGAVPRKALEGCTARMGGCPLQGETKRIEVVRLTSLIYNDIYHWMIRSYRDRDTERLAAGEKVRHWEPFRRQAEKRLRILDAAASLNDLAALNSNRLEALKGNRKGQYSIRINAQWRICFKWARDEPGPSNVGIVDYH
ncbi:MAG: type II toxin-antitoxin system RelE/ParE family toxin [Bryobacteraceae bacterium]|nr:type II toxin-antitoxin system RelE/ParE family toxin [Bryobacteraceae bacterium]